MTAAERATRATAADELCRTAYTAAGGSKTGVALVAVGGYGRAELSPASDLDVVLVHEDDVEPGALASDLWYPLWDSGWRVDHAVRSFSQMLEAASDLKVAMGLLDVRHLAGDPALTVRLRTTVLTQWRRQAKSRLPELRELCRQRHTVLGEIAHTSVPDLKEGEGGLRDAGVLRALRATWLVDVSDPALERSRSALLDVRDVLHDVAGRPTDRVAPDAWGPLAEGLGLADAAAAQRHVRTLGRRIAHLAHLTWRRVDGVLVAPATSGRRAPEMHPLAPGLALSQGEVVLDRTARPAEDPSLLLRAAAEAAVAGAALAPATAARLQRECPDLPSPMPAPARDALVRLLGAGENLLPVWETLEEVDAVGRFLPEWERVRLLPHASEVHRFTIDRHMVETCVAAASLVGTVGRPDLLLVAALLHDIGKGTDQDHSVVGERLARDVVERWGFDKGDQDLICLLVRQHLLLVNLATTRDPDDPATVAALLEKVDDAEALSLLRALSEADAKATAPQAWTSWRATLIDRLHKHAETALGSPAPVVPTDTHAEIVVPERVRRDPSAVAIDIDRTESGATISVVGSDRVGLLADVAGALLALRVPVRALRAWSQHNDRHAWGCSTWEVADPLLDAALLQERLDRAASATAARRQKALASKGSPPGVRVWPDGSQDSAVLEVRMEDRPGVLHRVLATLVELDLTVCSAHVATLGSQAVDVFYVQEPGGVRPREERAAAAAHAVREALGG